MAIVSVGYDGTVDETQWANLVGKAGSSEYGVDLAGDFQVTPVAGVERTIRISPGKAWGHGVLDVMDVEQTIQVPAALSGVRYDMIVLRRDWQPPGGSTTLAVIEGTSTWQNLPPRNAGTLGILDDQPIAMIAVTQGSTSIGSVADLRVWARNGGATAKDTRALQYLAALGSTVEINDTVWIFKNGPTGPEWRDSAKLGDTGWVDLTMRNGWKAWNGVAQVRRIGSRIKFRGGAVNEGASGDSVAFIVPAGFRPPTAGGTLEFPVTARATAVQFSLRIGSDGLGTIWSEATSIRARALNVVDYYLD